MSLTCCGQNAKWVSISPSIEYWYCDGCKKEVETTDQLRSRLQKELKLEETIPNELTEQEIEDLFSSPWPYGGGYDPNGDMAMMKNHFLFSDLYEDIFNSKRCSKR